VSQRTKDSLQRDLG